MSESEKTEIPKEEQKEHPPFYLSLKRILTTTHHTDIGVMYIVTSFFFFFLAGVSALFLRAELARPGEQIIEAAVYNSLLTLHGSTMIFLWIIPVFVGFANYLLPTMIGARDMYFPKLIVTDSDMFYLILCNNQLCCHKRMSGSAKFSAEDVIFSRHIDPDP